MEIISADAMQLYRGMDIGTAKITPGERRGIAHHQLDVLDLQDVASVASYQRYAREDLAETQRRGKVAVVVGGSGLYVSALLDELEFPGRDPVIRTQLEAQAEDNYSDLLAELAERDPESYRTIDSRNQRRVIRALEVIRATGQPFTPNLSEADETTIPISFRSLSRATWHSLRDLSRHALRRCSLRGC